MVEVVILIRLAQYLENSWRCYLATIANYWIVCCEVGYSTVDYYILPTAWLPVAFSFPVSLTFDF